MSGGVDSHETVMAAAPPDVAIHRHTTDTHTKGHTHMARSLDKVLTKHVHTPIDKATALLRWVQFRAAHGMGGAPRLLGNPLDNLKVRKSKVPTWTLTLAAHSTSGAVNVCDKSTPQCRKACVMLTAGNAYMPSVLDGRSIRTKFLADMPDHFLTLLTHEVAALERRGTPFGLRLNMASDLRWEYIAPWLFHGPNVRAYDYTKYQPHDRAPFANYRLTYSHSEARIWSDTHVADLLAMGHNVALVFDAHKHELPAKWHGMRVIDGDLSDYRYDDPKGVIIGLAAKGSAQTLDVGGFKVRAA